MIKISQAYMCLLVEDLCGFKKREYLERMRIHVLNDFLIPSKVRNELFN